MSGFLGTDIKKLWKCDADLFFNDENGYYQVWVVTDRGVIVSCDTIDAGGYVSIYKDIDQCAGLFPK